MKRSFIIDSEGRDTGYCIGGGPQNRDAGEALAANPLAPAEVLMSAAQDRVDRIKVLVSPFRFLPNESAEAIPAYVLGDFLAALGAIANEANQLLDFATTLQHDAKRGAE